MNLVTYRHEQECFWQNYFQQPQKWKQGICTLIAEWIKLFYSHNETLLSTKNEQMTATHTTDETHKCNSEQKKPLGERMKNKTKDLNFI